MLSVAVLGLETWETERNGWNQYCIVFKKNVYRLTNNSTLKRMMILIRTTGGVKQAVKARKRDGRSLHFVIKQGRNGQATGKMTREYGLSLM